MKIITLARRIAIYNAKANNFIDTPITQVSPFNEKDLSIEHEQLRILTSKEYPGFDIERVLTNTTNKLKHTLTPQEIIQEIEQYIEDTKNEQTQSYNNI
jgi:hypothetical protein